MKGCGLFPFALNVYKNKSKNFRSKYIQKLHNHAKQYATNALNNASKK